MSNDFEKAKILVSAYNLVRYKEFYDNKLWDRSKFSLQLYSRNNNLKKILKKL